MEYRERRVAPPLDLFVECVWFLSTPRGGTLTGPEQTILPDGCIEIIVHVAEPFHAVRPGGWEAQPAAFVAGMLTRPLRVGAAPGADTIGVRFRPGGAYPFFGCPLALLTDRVTPLEDLWGPAAREYAARLHAAADDEARAAIVCAALVQRLARAEVDRGVAAAVRDFIRSAGRVSVAAAAGRAGLTPRHLQRRFASHVGVTPKTLARILRFQNTLRRRGDEERCDWLAVAIDCGYTDQSHLIHDYAAFAGETPASLRAAEGELSAYFTAPQRLAALFDARL